MVGQGNDAQYVAGQIKSVVVVGGNAVRANHTADLLFSTKHAGVAAATEKMRLDASGNLGLGVTPSALWDPVMTAIDLGFVGCGLSSSGASQIVLSGNLIFDDTDDRWELASNGLSSQIQQNVGVITFSTQATGTAGDAYAGTAKLTIGNAGRVDTYTAAANNSIAVTNAHATTPYGVSVDFSAWNSGDTTQWFFQGSNSDNSKQFIVYSDGSVQGTANSYGGISDVALKTNITPARDYWDDWKKLKYSKWQWTNEYEKDGDEAKQLFGIVAQDLAEVFPGCTYDTDEGLAVRTSVVNTIGGRVLQRAQERIEDVENKITSLDTTMQTFMGRDIERKTELETLREKVTAQGKEISDLQERLKKAA